MRQTPAHRNPRQIDHIALGKDLVVTGAAHIPVGGEEELDVVSVVVPVHCVIIMVLVPARISSGGGCREPCAGIGIVELAGDVGFVGLSKVGDGGNPGW